MKPKKQIYKKNGVLLTFTCLAALAAAVQYAFRINYVFVDIAVFHGLSALLMGLAVVTALILLALTTLKLNRLAKNGKLVSDSRAFSVLTVLSEGAAVFLVIYNLGNLIGAGEETTPVMLKMFAKGLPLFLGLCTVAFLLCIYPVLKNGVLKKCIAAVLALGVLGSTV